jgi:hypothetical protein
MVEKEKLRKIDGEEERKGDGRRRKRERRKTWSTLGERKEKIMRYL